MARRLVLGDYVMAVAGHRRDACGVVVASAVAVAGRMTSGGVRGIGETPIVYMRGAGGASGVSGIGETPRVYMTSAGVTPLHS